jgi:hypothetical protein
VETFVVPKTIVHVLSYKLGGILSLTKT